MSWFQQTTFEMMGRKYRRVYHYWFHKKWYDRFRFMPYKFQHTFHTNETNVNGDAMGHREVLCKPDFEVNGINVVEWLKETYDSGKMDFHFTIFQDDFPEWDKAWRSLNKPLGSHTTFILTSQFSSKKHAVLFKLMFGNG